MMNKFIISIILFLSITIRCYSQKIFEVDTKYKADVSAYVTSNEYKADLLVYKLNSELSVSGNNGTWVFVDKTYKADKKVYFVSSEYQADLIIFYVENEYQAGWKNSEKKYLLNKTD